MVNKLTILQGPKLYNRSNDGVIIWWETDGVGDGNNFVRVNPTASPGSTTDYTAKTFVIPNKDKAVVTTHASTVTGLIAGTSYQFKIFGLSLETNPATFGTHPDDGSEVVIGVFGSTEGNASTFSDLVARVFFETGREFLLTGGYVQDGESYNSWVNDWLNNFSVLISSVTGCRGVPDGESKLAQAMMPNLGEGKGYYDLSIGNARIVVLNTLEGASRNSLKLGAAQSEWFLSNAAQTAAWKAAAYRIVLLHHPFRTTFWDQGCNFGDKGTIDILKDNLLPALKLSGADLVLQGNSRSYQRGGYQSTYSDLGFTVHHVVTGGGGAPMHTNKCFDWQAPDDPGILVDSSLENVVILKLTTEKMVVEAVDKTGAITIDKFTVLPHTLP